MALHVPDLKKNIFFSCTWWKQRNDDEIVLLTLMPSQRDTARNGRNARNVRIERNAGISAAPAQIAPKFTNDNWMALIHTLNIYLFVVVWFSIFVFRFCFIFIFFLLARCFYYPNECYVYFIEMQIWIYLFINGRISNSSVRNTFGI